MGARSGVDQAKIMIALVASAARRVEEDALLGKVVDWLEIHQPLDQTVPFL